MSEANKETAKKFMIALINGDVSTLKAICTEDLQVVTTGSAAVSGLRNYDAVMQTAAAFPQITKSGARMDFLAITAEDDRVACQIDGFITMIDGKEYNNQYHNLFFFRGNRICKMVEYLDLMLADARLGPYLPPKG